MKVPKGYEGQTILRRTLLGKDSVREYLRQLEVSTSERDVEVMTMSLNAAPDQLVKTLAVTYQEKGVEGITQGLLTTLDGIHKNSGRILWIHLFWNYVLLVAAQEDNPDDLQGVTDYLYTCADWLTHGRSNQLSDLERLCSLGAQVYDRLYGAGMAEVQNETA